MKKELRFGVVAGGDRIINGTHSFFNRFYGTVLLFMLMMSGGVFGQVKTWNTTNASGAWLTAGNWLPNGVPASSNIATFSNSAPSIGINTNTNNGIAGALDFSGTQDLIIANSAGSATGTLTLSGTTVNGIDNVIIRSNSSSRTLTIRHHLTIGNSNALSLVLGNSTNNIINIDGNAGVVISTAITGGTNRLTLGGSGTGALTLSGANTYTGETTINSGKTLIYGATNVTSNSSNIVLNGGTFQTGATTGFSDTVGTLNLNASSTLALGTGNHTLTFANSNAVTWAGSTLTISGWTGTAGASGTNGKVFVGSNATGLTTAQLAKISFNGYSGPATILATGEIVPSAGFTVTFNSNGGSGTMSDQTASSATNLTSNTFTRTNYNFSGWNTAANGSGTAYANSASYPFTASETLYAQWRGNVSYDANGGTGTVTDATNYAPAQSVTTASGAGFTRSGYAFIGWNTLANGLGTSYTASQVGAFSFTGNTTLYAVWNPVGSHTVIFEANGGTGTMANQVESSATALTTNAFTRTGYTFANWNTAANGSGTTYTNGQTYSFASNITLYAQWTPNNNTVTFDANTGTGTMASQTIATAATANLNANTFTKTGYTFAGWATTAGGAVAYANSASYTMGTSNVTLYAKWTANNNTITFDGNGSTSGTMANQTIATDASAALTTNAFVRTGYTFAGWATSAAGAVAYADGATYTMGTSNVTLYAKWNVVVGPCYTEDMSNLGTISAYNSGTWSGAGGTWSATDARGDQTINGKAITFRDGVVTSPTFSDGIGSLTVTTKYPFGDGTGTIKVYVNNIEVGTLNMSTSAQTQTISNINVAGSVVIEFRNTSSSKRPAIDDINWTCYTGCTDPANPNGSISTTQNCGNTSLIYAHGSGQPETDVAYYWQTTASGTSTANPTSSTFAPTTAGTYHVRAKSTLGNCWSAGTVSQAVTVVAAHTITTEPANQTVPAGTTATFTVVASNATAYQWQVNTGSGWNNVSTGTGGTTASYTTPTTTLAMSSYQYKVIVSGTSPCAAIESAVRTLTVSPVITYANLQFPGSQTIAEGSTFQLYGQVYAESLTEAAGAGAGITAQFGYNSSDTDPSTWTAGNWTSGTFNSQVGNNDEFTATIGTGLVPGTYYYATRYRIGTGNWVYGGYNNTLPTAGGIWNGTSNYSGVLTVNSNLVDFGNYQFPATGNIVLGDVHNIYGQVYEPSVTEPPFSQGTGITAEAGYNASNTNPNTWTNWFPATYNNVASGNNDEYMYNIGANLPSAGTYYLAFRYRKTGSTEYVFGGTNGIWNNDNATVTVVAPKEINIRQNTTDIASNGTYGFGNQVSSTSSSIVTFTIQNTGGVALNLTGTPRVAISGTNAAEFTINQATLPATVAPNSSETFTVTFTPIGLGAKTAQLSIANDDSDENPYLVNLTGTGTASAASNIIANSSFTYGPINYLTYINSNITVANSVELGQFIIQDGGGSTDADNLATTLSTLSFTVGNAANLERLAIYDGTTEIAEVAAAATTNFTGLTALTAADGGTKTFSVRGSFKTAVTDNQRITLTVASATAANTGSTFGTITATTSTTGTDNVIQVTADRLGFAQQPSNTSINVAMTPVVTVSANDVNGNRDVDHTGNVSITSSGTLTGSPVTVAFSSGLASFSTLTHTVSGTGFSLTATSTGLTNGISDPFNITTIVYTTNDYRTTSNGTWSTQNAGTATWENWNGSAWVSSGRPTSTLHHAIMRHTITSNGNTSISSITVEGPNTSEGTPGGNYSFTHTSTVSTKLWIKEYGVMTAGAALTNSGIFEVENHGTVNINYAAASGTAAIWNGTENFHSGSLFNIQNWNYGASGEAKRLIQNPSTISTNSQGYNFGNLKISGALSAIFSMVSGNQNINLAENDFTVEVSGNNVTFTTTASANITIGGDVIVNSGQLSVASATNGNPIINVLGNITAMGGTININQNNSSNVQTTLNLQGNLHIASGASLLSSDTDSIFNFCGIGDGLTPTSTQTISVANQSTASNISFNIVPPVSPANSTTYVKLINQQLTLGSNSKLTVNNNGTLDFGFDGSNNALYISGNAFESQAGSTLKITSDAGIVTTGTSTGNVRTTTKTYAPLGDFHYIGKNNQATGTGLPTNVRNLVVHNEGATNNLTITNANAIVTGTLTMTQGNIVSTTSNLLTIGTSTSTLGTLNYTSGVVKGSGGTIGTMRRYFGATNTGDATGLFPLGTTANEKRFIKTEFTGTNGGYLDATFVEADMGDNGLLDLSSIPAVGSCAAFTVLNTDEDLFWRVTPQTGTLTNGTHHVTLTKDDTSDICKQTVLKRETTSSDWLNPGTHLAGVVNSGNHIVSRSAMNGPLKDFGLGDGHCSGTPIVYNGGAWPATTKLTPIVINANATLPAGITEVCECSVSDNVTVTVPSNATLSVVNGITMATGANPDGSQDGKITILDSGSLVQITNVDNATANNNTGNIRMQRYTKPVFRYDFTYWGSPVTEDSDFTLKKLSPLTLYNKYFKWESDAWSIISNGTEAMVPGRGYIVRAPQTYAIEAPGATPGTFEANFIGKPNNGIVRYAVSGSSTEEKWSLLGNPYASAIDAEAFLDLNADTNNLLGGTLYFWTHNTGLAPVSGGYTYNSGDYAAWNGSGSVGTIEAPSAGGDPDDNEVINDNVPNGYIAAGQSFFVQAMDSGQAVFDNTMRIASNNNQFFRPSQPEPITNWDMVGKHRIWLNMKGQTKGFSQLLVGYIENATNGLDRRYDGQSFGGNQVTFYSVLDTKKLVIQGRALPFNNQDEVTLGYNSTLNGTLIINIDHYDGLFEGQGVYLEDKLLNIVHDLKASPYTFTSTTGTFDQRFVLRFLPSEQLSNPDHNAIANSLIVYQNQGRIMIKSQLEDLEQVTIYDLLGRNIFDKTSIGQKEFGIQNVAMNEQPLIVKVKLANGQIVNKKIVH